MADIVLLSSWEKMFEYKFNKFALSGLNSQ